jgi:hypothetical protein
VPSRQQPASRRAVMNSAYPSPFFSLERRPRFAPSVSKKRVPGSRFNYNIIYRQGSDSVAEVFSASIIWCVVRVSKRSARTKSVFACLSSEIAFLPAGIRAVSRLACSQATAVSGRAGSWVRPRGGHHPSSGRETSRGETLAHACMMFAELHNNAVIDGHFRLAPNARCDFGPARLLQMPGDRGIHENSVDSCWIKLNFNVARPLLGPRKMDHATKLS